MTRDIITPTKPLSLNSYTYTNADPINHTDPTGLAQQATLPDQAGNWLGDTFNEDITQDPVITDGPELTRKQAISIAKNATAVAGGAVVTGGLLLGCGATAGFLCIVGAGALGGGFASLSSSLLEGSNPDPTDVAISMAVGGAFSGLGAGADKLANRAVSGFKVGSKAPLADDTIELGKPAPLPVIAFTDETVAHAYSGMRSGGGHAIRHLRDEGLIKNAGSLASQVSEFEQLTSPILTSPSKVFDWQLGGTMTRGFAGEVGGRRVVVFVATEGPYKGRVISAVAPDAKRAAQWGLR